MRILISGGPGSGCTSTAEALSARWQLPVFDSDAYFHKPTDPPFQVQWTPEERRTRLGSALGSHADWVLSGSVATWGLDALTPTHGVFLDIPRKVRLARLMERQQKQFGSRIEADGDMQEEHRSFLEWAGQYEGRSGWGRNRETDRAFLEARCEHFLAITEDEALEVIVAKITCFLADLTSQGKRMPGVDVRPV